MKALIIKDVSKFPIKATLGGVWQPTNNTISGDYWLQLEAQSDLDKAGIEYKIGEVEIKVEEI
jgi:hypothetical protein